MKTFRLIGMALLAVVMCVNFTSCSDDDDNANSAIQGTQEYTSSTDEGLNSGYFTFKSDGSLIWNDGEDITSNNSYILQLDKLKIILNDNDDYLIGTIVFSGNKATYNDTWHDCDGQWDHDEIHSMMLTKQ